MWFIMTLIICTIEAVAQPSLNLTIPAVIAFGDSIVDQGTNNDLNTLIKCNFPPYGEDFLGGLATGRFSNAKTPLDMTATELGVKELVPAYLDPNLQSKDLLTGVSFASGDAGYDPQTSALVSVLTSADQLKLFKEYTKMLKFSVGKKQAKYIISNSLYIVVAGTDDLANTYFNDGIGRAKYDIVSYTDLMVDSASNFIQDLHTLGARRVAVFGVPPIGCLPSQRTLAGGILRVCSEEQNEAAELYNSKLSTKLDSLAKVLPNSKVLYIDIYNPLLDIIQHPQIYGIEVVDRGCCGTGDIEVGQFCNRWSKMCVNNSKYLFWDSYHPTQTGYEILVHHVMENNVHRFI